MKSFDQKTVYIMPQNLWMLYQYIDAFLMLNIGIMQKIAALFSWAKIKSNKCRGAPEGEVLRVVKSGRGEGRIMR